MTILNSVIQYQRRMTQQQGQWLIGISLLLLMIATRSHITHHLQDASWAVFLLAGFYLRSVRMFALFFFAAFLTDLVVIDAQGGQHYCFTPSYPFLIPAYAALWYAGRWLRDRIQSLRNPIRFSLAAGAALILGVTACFVISNAGFYLFSGKFTEMNLVQYIQSVIPYLGAYLQTSVVYLGFAALLHFLFTQADRAGQQHLSRKTSN